MEQGEYLKQLKLRTRNEYQRDNFDRFLKHVKFSFSLPIIHISGTNGKGSVGKMISNIYIEKGYKVGHFLSPYFLSPLEMIMVNDISIPSLEFKDMFYKYIELFEKFNLSEFEIETFIAYKFFEQSKCDICVIECGMGGEIDATNIVDNTLLSIITNIGIEHSLFLGDSISEIAFHKAGIIKKHSIVVTGALDEESKDIISSRAKEMKCSYIEVSEYFNNVPYDEGYLFSYRNLKDIYIPSKALYSLKNACIAIETVKALNNLFPIDEQCIRKGISVFSLSGRMTILNKEPEIIVDGAHNPSGTKALKETFEGLNKPNIHIVFSCFKDKNLPLMLSELNFISSDITLTTFPHPRARKEEEFFLYLEEYKFVDDYLKVINDLIEKYPKDTILITGSLAFVRRVIKDFHDGKIKKNTIDQ